VEEMIEASEAALMGFRNRDAGEKRPWKFDFVGRDYASTNLMRCLQGLMKTIR
jgi:hypothetical protein